MFLFFTFGSNMNITQDYRIHRIKVEKLSFNLLRIK